MFFPNINESSRTIKQVICSVTTVILQRAMCLQVNYREHDCSTIIIVQSSFFVSPLNLKGQKATQRLLAQSLFIFLGACIKTIYHLWVPAALMAPAPERIPAAAMPSISEHLQKQNHSTWNHCGAITLLKSTLPYPVFPAPGLHCGIVPARSFPLSAPPGSLHITLIIGPPRWSP